MKRSVMLAGVSLSMLLAAAGGVASADGALQGAWTMGGTGCEETFETVDGTVRFRNRDSSLNTGVIIRGDTMMGPNSTCGIGRITESKGLYKVHLSCASSIMFSDISVTLQLVGNDHFRRVDPDFPEISRDYTRCM